MKTLHDFDGNIIGYLDDVNMQIVMLQGQYKIKIQEEKILKDMMGMISARFGRWKLKLVPSKSIIKGRLFTDENSLTLVLSNNDVGLIRYIFCDESNGWIEIEEFDEKRSISSISSIKEYEDYLE